MQFPPPVITIAFNEIKTKNYFKLNIVNNINKIKKK